MKPLLSGYINQLKDIISGDLWASDNYETKLKGIDENNAFTRPIDNIHSVAEIISHIIEWNASVLSVWQTGKGTVSMDSLNNWRTNVELKKDGWENLLKKLHTSQKEVIDFLSQQNDEWLKKSNPGSKHEFEYHTIGLIHHYVYHLGQMGITIKFLSK